MLGGYFFNVSSLSGNSITMSANSKGYGISGYQSESFLMCCNYNLSSPQLDPIPWAATAATAPGLCGHTAVMFYAGTWSLDFSGIALQQWEFGFDSKQQLSCMRSSAGTIYDVYYQAGAPPESSVWPPSMLKSCPKDCPYESSGGPARQTHWPKLLPAAPSPAVVTISGDFSVNVEFPNGTFAMYASPSTNQATVVTRSVSTVGGTTFNITITSVFDMAAQRWYLGIVEGYGTGSTTECCSSNVTGTVSNIAFVGAVAISSGTCGGKNVTFYSGAWTNAYAGGEQSYVYPGLDAQGTKLPISPADLVLQAM